MGQYIIIDYLKDENKKYPWYQNMENGKTPRYKLYKPRPYDDADYYWANSFDKNIWYIHFGNTYSIKNPIATIIGTENAINYLIKLNENVNPRMIYN